MILDPVTNRWADALFEVAKRADALDEVQHDTERLSREVASPKVAAFLFGGGVSQEDRAAKMGKLLDELHPKTRDFVKLLLERRRQDVLPGIGEAFKRKVYDATGRVEGTVATPRELGTEELEKLQTAIGKRLGKTVVLSQRIAPELIAGVSVTVGARLFDATVKGRLESMRERLLSASLPS